MENEVLAAADKAPLADYDKQLLEAAAKVATTVKSIREKLGCGEINSDYCNKIKLPRTNARYFEDYSVFGRREAKFQHAKMAAFVCCCRQEAGDELIKRLLEALIEYNKLKINGTFGGVYGVFQTAYYLGEKLGPKKETDKLKDIVQKRLDYYLADARKCLYEAFGDDAFEDNGVKMKDWFYERAEKEWSESRRGNLAAAGRSDVMINLCVAAEKTLAAENGIRFTAQRAAQLALGISEREISALVSGRVNIARSKKVDALIERLLTDDQIAAAKAEWDRLYNDGMRGDFFNRIEALIEEKSSFTEVAAMHGVFSKKQEHQFQDREGLKFVQLPGVYIRDAAKTKNQSGYYCPHVLVTMLAGTEAAQLKTCFLDEQDKILLKEKPNLSTRARRLKILRMYFAVSFPVLVERIHLKTRLKKEQINRDIDRCKKGTEMEFIDFETDVVAALEEIGEEKAASARKNLALYKKLCGSEEMGVQKTAGPAVPIQCPAEKSVPELAKKKKKKTLRQSEESVVYKPAAKKPETNLVDLTVDELLTVAEEYLTIKGFNFLLDDRFDGMQISIDAVIDLLESFSGNMDGAQAERWQNILKAYEERRTRITKAAQGLELGKYRGSTPF